MKKYTLLIMIMIFISCKNELPDQFTSVEGYVTDYYSSEPVPDIPLEVTEYMLWDFYDQELKTDTIITDNSGNYYYEFYNKDNRDYEIKTLQTESYYFSNLKRIIEGKIDTINFAIKPFKTLTLNCYNQNNIFNRLRVYSYLEDNEYKCYPCRGLEVCDFKIIPEFENEFYIGLVHYNENNEADSSKGEHFKFYSGITDTTINYYY